MTERRHDAVSAQTNSLAIGPSSVCWRGDALEFHVDEVTTPLPSRIRGKVRVFPNAITGHVVSLDAAGQHRWWPIAPCARIEVAMQRPALGWSGTAYWDCNNGDAPLENAVRRWHWSRAPVRDGTVIGYDVERRNSEPLSLALRFDRNGNAETFSPPNAVSAGRTGWVIDRQVQADTGHVPVVVRTLEDTPFYARSLVRTVLNGQAVTAMHESLLLDRFAKPWVQMLLPFRMPRL